MVRTAIPRLTLRIVLVWLGSVVLAGLRPFPPELERANRLLVGDKHEEALALARSVLQRTSDPGATASAAHIARCALRLLKREGEIEPMYAELLKKYPDQPELIRQNAEWQLYCGRFREALAGFTRMVSPDEAAQWPQEVYRHLSSCHIGLGNIAEAKRWFVAGRAEPEQALTKLFDERLSRASDPTVRVKFVKELILSDRGPVEPCHAAAAKELSDILDMKGLSPQLTLECTFLMATSLFESWQYARAAEAFGKAAALARAAPPNLRGQHLGLSLFNQGYALAKAKERDQAIEVFLTLIDSSVDDRDPGGHIMETCRSYRHRAAVEISKCCEAKGQLAEAYEWTRRALGQHKLVSWCGTCQNLEEEKLKKRLDMLARRAGGVVLMKHAVTSGLVLRHWYLFAPVVAALALVFWALRRRRSKRRTLRAEPARPAP